MWKHMAKEKKDQYFELARLVDAEHKKKYPGKSTHPAVVAAPSAWLAQGLPKFVRAGARAASRTKEDNAVSLSAILSAGRLCNCCNNNVSENTQKNMATFFCP